MNCEKVRGKLALLLYGELPLDEEELVEAHLDGCGECRAARVRERALQDVLDRRELMPSPALLREARARLDAALGAEAARGRLWERVKSYFWLPPVGKPAGAVALLAIGFFAARLLPLGNLPGIDSAGVFDPNTARVRYVEPGQSGQVQIVVDETRQRVFSGRLDDARIRGLLMAAAKDPNNPGLRGESVEILKSQSEDGDVRNALLYALQHDSNVAVRLKALEGLQPYVAHPDVRKALSHTLLADDNPGIRTQAIDLLMNGNQQQHLVGVFQELMRKEDNGYIRLRCEKALHAMKASVETY